LLDYITKNIYFIIYNLKYFYTLGNLKYIFFSLKEKYFKLYNL